MRAVLGLLGAVVLAVAGCHAQEYVVTRPDAPFFATRTATAPIETLPLGHHDDVMDSAHFGERVVVWYRGRTGFVRREDVELVEFLSPCLDDGADRDAKVGRASREVLVARRGRLWPAAIREAVLAGRVLHGMSVEQVETAWGSPASVEPLGPARERWTYRRGAPLVTTTADSLWSFEIRSHTRLDRWESDTPVRTRRIPGTEERVLELEAGVVTRYELRWYPGERWKDAPSPPARAPSEP